VTEGIESAIRQARAAAGEKEINVIGAASTAQQCLKAGLADELHVDILPVLPGRGLRPLEGLDADQTQLE
jgi:dihydrofolate reductase